MKSSRLPRKALLDIGGKPMTLRLIERLRVAEAIDEVVICTSAHRDDAILMELAKEWGVEALAGSEDDVLSRLIMASERYEADLVVRVTGDNVLTDPEIMNRMVLHHIATEADYTRTNGLPLGITADVISTPMLSWLHKLMPDPNQSEYMMLYAFDPDHFHCQVLKAPPEVNRPFYSLTVDTPDDLMLIRRIYSELPGRKGGPRLVDIVALLDTDSNYRPLSGTTPIRLPGGSTTSFSELLVMLDERAEQARKKYGPKRSR
jgi:spore coat polysaccharide biosynthesis protein SpsF